MKVSFDFIVRIVGMVAFAYLGAEMGISLSQPSPDKIQLLATQLLMIAGAGLGLIVTPKLTIKPVSQLLKNTRSVPLSELFFVFFGGFTGLITGVLLSVPLSMLPAPLDQYIPIVATLVFVYIGAMMFSTHRRSMQDWNKMINRFKMLPVALPASTPAQGGFSTSNRYLLDTSAIIDGRIAAIGETGFVDGTLLVPQFVLLELQTLADSSDELRRGKGRRGLELLSQMQKKPSPPVEIVDEDVSGLVRVDDKLVMLARQNQCPIITNDFNLNRVAELQGVKVLNLNQLSDSLRPPIVQDQHLEVQIRNEGNSRQQGVGYLEDGTPVIVEDARHLIGQQVSVIVSRLHQTQTGRLVFAHLDHEREPPKKLSGNKKAGDKH